MQPRTRNIVLRVLTVPVVPVAGLILVEVLYVGALMAAVSPRDVDGYLWLAGAFVLAAICAAAIKFIFNLRLRLWIILLLVFLAVVAFIIYLVATSFA